MAIADGDGLTSVAGVWVAGNVANPAPRSSRPPAKDPRPPSPSTPTWLRTTCATPSALSSERRQISPRPPSARISCVVRPSPCRSSIYGLMPCMYRLRARLLRHGAEHRGASEASMLIATRDASTDASIQNAANRRRLGWKTLRGVLGSLGCSSSSRSSRRSPRWPSTSLCSTIPWDTSQVAESTVASTWRRSSS